MTTTPEPAAPKKTAGTDIPADGTLEQGLRVAAKRRQAPAAGPDVASDAAEWMITYMDVVTWLLVVFVILLAQANFEDPGQPDQPPPLATAASQLDGVLAAAGVGLADELRAALALAGLGGDVDVLVAEPNVEMIIGQEVLFTSGEAGLRSSGIGVLNSLAPILNGLARAITVEGHTDNVPIATAQFPSNWHLSSARASAVAQFLTGRGLPGANVRAVGYADTPPIADNRTDEGRTANRRVGLVLHGKGF